MQYFISVFISAFLIFQIQPIISKIILPWFGGGASVWTTCMLFFQFFLLIGYLYSDENIESEASDCCTSGFLIM